MAVDHADERRSLTFTCVDMYPGGVQVEERQLPVEGMKPTRAALLLGLVPSANRNTSSTNKIRRSGDLVLDRTSRGLVLLGQILSLVLH